MPKQTTNRFDVTCMPSGRIHPRKLEQFSVHLNAGSWVATIVKPSVDQRDSTIKKSVSFKFKTEREAKRFAKAYSPPKLTPVTPACQVCAKSFQSRKPCACRNCGACICDKCSTRWGIRMIPKTFLSSSHQQSLTVRVCTSCDWLSNAFCMALLRGNLDDAVAIVSTNNVNLRTSFADINREAMFPLHCAVIGGNLQLLQWLVETHSCPVAVKRDRASGRMISIHTSAKRSLMDLAMSGKPKLDIMRYLVVKHKLSLMDSNDPKLAPRTLESLLRSRVPITEESGPAGSEDRDPPNIIESFSSVDSVTTIEDACNLCYEHSMDCVMTPCGHQCCCSQCGAKLSTCPVCKVPCSVLKVFR